MVGKLLAQRSDLLWGNGARVIPPLASLVRDDVGKFLIGQRLVPGLHHRAAVLLALYFDGTGQTFKHYHGHSVRATSSKFGTRQRRILAWHAKTVRLMTCLAVGRKNLLSPIVRRKFSGLLSALRPGNFFHGWHF